jgi:rubrerythrin
MREQHEMGINRTGIGMSPLDSKDIIGAAQEAAPSSSGGIEQIASLRSSYAKEAEPVGTLPPPSSLKGAAKTAMDAVAGKKSSVLLDKLGQRLAFERTGTRLYEALLTKLDAQGSWENGPKRHELQELHDEELSHFELLQRAFKELGADPTAQTPAADIDAVASMGILKVLSDPRTTLAQCLESILFAELVDNDGWQMLIEVAQELGHDELVKGFQAASDEEAKHLACVRRWLNEHNVRGARAETRL